ncbi:YbjQ family protein [Candidatus Pelagibacter sp.]|nr:YbjQ family protein [Candidatus Pelagibacter sp.]
MEHIKRLIVGDALKQLKIKAVRAGANGVIDITFDSRGTDTFRTNCWESVQASGTAVVFK